MAVQPFTQVIFGQPKIRISFNTAEIAGNANKTIVLQGLVLNQPITKGPLAWIKVTRITAKDLFAEFEIIEFRTQKKEFNAVPIINTFTGLSAQRVTLSASHVPGTFGIAFYLEGEGIVRAGLTRDGPELKVGLYEVRVTVDVASKLVANSKRRFVVQSDLPFAYWVRS